MIGMHWNSLRSTLAVLALGCTLTGLVRAQVLAPEPLPLDDASGKGPHSYVTRQYANSEFSNAEWQAPEKTGKLEALRKLASELNDPAMEARKHPQ